MIAVSGCQRRSDRGAAATEVALLVPVVLLVMAVMVGGARVWFARAAVTDAAQAAARAATLERSAGQARAAGEMVATTVLTDVPCASHSLVLDTAGFAVPVGNPAQIRATITCSVNLADLAGMGIPGTLTVTASAASALDTYRRRQ